MAFLRRFLVPMLAGLALAAAGPAVGARVEAATWTVGGVERNFWVATPDGWDGQTPLPLVLALHPFGSNGDAFLRSSGWLDVSDRHRVMVISPDGSSGSRIKCNALLKEFDFLAKRFFWRLPSQSLPRAAVELSGDVA